MALANLYIAGKNYDGTGTFPQYYSLTSQSNGQRQFCVPSGTVSALTVAMTNSVTAVFCDGSSTPIYKVNGLYGILEPTGKVVVTAVSAGNSRYLQLYVGTSNGIPCLFFSNTDAALSLTSTWLKLQLNPIGNLRYTSTTDADGYLNVTLAASPTCASQNFIVGCPVMVAGKVYLVDPAEADKYYTYAVPGQSFYMIMETTIYGTAPGELQAATSAPPVGQTIENYIKSLLGVVPTPMTAISTTPSPVVGSGGLSAEEVLALERRSNNISKWSMIGIFIFIGVLCVIAVVIFIFTMRKYPDTRILYDKQKKVLTDLPPSNVNPTPARPTATPARPIPPIRR